MYICYEHSMYISRIHIWLWYKNISARSKIYYCGTIMSIRMWWGSVCLWMGDQGRDLIARIFEAALECPEDLSLSILAQRQHKSCARETGREGEGH